jgi:small subunit ribosomal protein S20
LRPDLRQEAQICKSINQNFKINMAHHASAKKRIRQDAKRRLRNRYYKKTARSAIQKLREMTTKKDAEAFLPKVISMIDKLAKNNTWHKNKASNLKGQLTRHVAGL